MRALVYEGPERLVYREVDAPAPGPDEVLVDLERSGICGSDMHAYLGHDDRRPAPLILGHEAAGRIASGPRAGTRVTINPLVVCGTCRACQAGQENLCPERQIISMPPRHGAFAQAVAMPLTNLVDLAAGMPFAQAALAEPLAVSWHAARLGLRVLPGAERALVLGGGAIGLGASLCLKAQGVAKVEIVEPNPARAAYLRDHCGEVVRDAAGGEWDVIVDAVGLSATRRAASALVRPGGVILHVGLGEDRGGLDVRRMTLQEITFLGTYTYSAQDFRDTVAAMTSGALGALDWIEERPLADGASAFADIRQGHVAAPKVVLIPG